jgi:ribosomal protein L35
MKHRTKKAAQKRFHVSSKGKVQHRSIGQAHFNARATGDVTRQKHSRAAVSDSDYGRLEQLIPHKLK